jgi:hypothetical protein
MFEGSEGSFADREIGRPKDDGTNPGGLFYRVGCLTDPPALLLVTGRAEIFVVFQPPVSPSVRSQLVPTVMTVPDQIRIGFREAASEEDRPLEMSSITKGQQHFESDVRAGHPIAVDRKVKPRESDLAMPIAIDRVLTVAVTREHYEWLSGMTETCGTR